MAYADRESVGKRQVIALTLSVALISCFSYLFVTGLAQRLIQTKTTSIRYIPPDIVLPKSPPLLPPTQTERITSEVPQPQIPRWEDPIIVAKPTNPTLSCEPSCPGTTESQGTDAGLTPIPSEKAPEKNRTGVDVQQLLRLYRQGDIPYPAVAERLNQEGTSRCTIHVLATGVVDIAQCAGAGEILDTAASRYLLHYHFPKAALAHADGLPVDAWATLPPIKWVLPRE